MSGLQGYSYLQYDQLEELKARLTVADNSVKYKASEQQYDDDIGIQGDLVRKDQQQFATIAGLYEDKADVVAYNSRTTELTQNDTRHEEQMNTLEGNYANKVSQFEFEKMVAELKANDDSQDARLDLLEQQFADVQVRIVDDFKEKANELVKKTDFNAMISTLQHGDTGLHNKIIQLASKDSINTALSNYNVSIANLQDKATYDTEINKVVQRNYDFEQRLMGIDQFFRVLAETYKLYKEDNTEIKYTADINSDIVINDGITVNGYKSVSGGSQINATLNQYLYNTLVGSLKVFVSGVVVGTATQSSFNSVSRVGDINLTASVAQIKANGFTIKQYNSDDTDVFQTWTFSSSQANALPDLTPITIAPYSPNTFTFTTAQNVSIPLPNTTGPVVSYSINTQPSGLTFISSTGAFGGSITTPNTYPITISAVSSSGQTVSTSITIVVNNPVASETFIDHGASYSITFTPTISTNNARIQTASVSGSVPPIYNWTSNGTVFTTQQITTISLVKPASSATDNGFYIRIVEDGTDIEILTPRFINCVSSISGTRPSLSISMNLSPSTRTPSSETLIGQFSGDGLTWTNEGIQFTLNAGQLTPVSYTSIPNNYRYYRAVRVADNSVIIIARGLPVIDRVFTTLIPNVDELGVQLTSSSRTYFRHRFRTTIAGNYNFFVRSNMYSNEEMILSINKRGINNNLITSAVLLNNITIGSQSWSSGVTGIIISSSQTNNTTGPNFILQNLDANTDYDIISVSTYNESDFDIAVAIENNNFQNIPINYIQYRFDTSSPIDTVLIQGSEPVITPINNPNTNIQPFTPITNIQVSATDSSYGWVMSNVPGLSINTSGVISGTPTIEGDYNVEIRAYSPTGIGITTFTLTVNPLSGVRSSGIQQWGKFIGGSLSDAYSTTTDGDGNIYLVGQVNTSVGINSTKFLNAFNTGSLEAYIIKYDKFGNDIWGRFIGGGSTDNARAVTVDKDKNVYVVGQIQNGSLNNEFRTVSNGGVFLNAPTNNSTDGYIIKYNANGVPLWGRFIGSSSSGSNESVWDVKTDSTGAVYVVGVFANASATGFFEYDTTGFFNTRTNVSGAPSQEGYIIKFSSGGVQQWGYFIGGAGASDNTYGLAIDKSDNIYIVGQITNTPSNLFATVANGGFFQNTYNSASNDAYIAKFSSTGTGLWGCFINGSGSELAWRVATDQNDDVYIVGTTAYSSASSDTSFNTNFLMSNTRGDLTSKSYIIKFSSAGARLWGRYVGGKGSNASTGDVIHNVVCDKDNNVYITGTSVNQISPFLSMDTTNFINTKTGETHRNAFVIKYNSIGTQLWGRFIGTSSTATNHGYGLAIDESTPNSRSLILAGHSAQGTASFTEINTANFINTRGGTSTKGYIIKFTA